MKKYLLLLLLPALILSACSASTGTTTDASSIPADPASRTLTPLSQVAVGIFKLEGTDQAVTAEQAKALLPLWQVYSSLSGSDTAAADEVQALENQILDGLTEEQMNAITALNLTQQDVLGLIQEQGFAMGGSTASGSRTTEDGHVFVPGSGGGPGGGGGPMMGGGPMYDGVNPGSGTPSPDSVRPSTMQRTPVLLIQAVIDFLTERAGA